MMRTTTLVIGAALLASLVLAVAIAAPAGKREGRPQLVLTGRHCDVRAPRCNLARSQEIFDGIWVKLMGDRVAKAAQGWPMTPQIDFDACDAIFVFGGDGFNANGFRVMDVIEAADAVTIRYERISYQTASFDGADHGDSVRPWAMLLLPATDKTILLEENTQGLIGGDPIWTQRSAFPGLIGVGRPVKGTRQRGE